MVQINSKMRKITLILVCVLSSVYFAYTQENLSLEGQYRKITGKYPLLSESLNLKADSTFEYHYQGEFQYASFQLKGKWRIDDGYLILNSDNRWKPNFEVKKTYNPSLTHDSLFLHITDFSNKKREYMLVVNKDDANEKEYYNTIDTDTLVIPKKDLYSLTIFSIVKFKTLFINECSSNIWDIKINPVRVMRNEKWLIVNNVIIPIGVNGEYVSYSLVKQSKN